MANESKRILLVIANKAKSEPLEERLKHLGWSVTLADTTVALKEVLLKTNDYFSTLLDVRLRPDDAARVLSSLCKTLPRSCKLLVASSYLDTKALDRLEQAKALSRIDIDIANLDPVITRLTTRSSSTEQIKYDINVINCFVSSMNEVLEYYVGEKAEHGKPTIGSGKKVPAGFVTSVVKFEGDQTKCTASLTCDKAFIIDIASRVNGMTKAEISEDRQAILSTFEEMTDQIFGKAELLLGRIGFEMKMGPLEIHLEEYQDIVLTSEVPVMVIPFTLARKKFYIGFSIQKI